MSRSIEEVTQPSDSSETSGTGFNFITQRIWRPSLLRRQSFLSISSGNLRRNQARCETHQEAISEEIADIGCYLFELADNLGIDLGEAILEKIQKNAHKYPVEKARGSHAKYNSSSRTG